MGALNSVEHGHIMVTGGAGYIGSHAILGLLDRGHKVVTVDNLSTGFAWAIDPRCDLIVGNVGDQNLIRKVIQDYNVQAILHFAGSISVPESVANPLKYYHNNTAESASLIESALAEGVKHFIFSSTASIYGHATTIPIPETAPLSPINPYAMSKLMTEQMLQDTASAHDFNFAALRYFNVAGADPQCRAGQSSAASTHLIKVAIDVALGNRDSIEIFGTDYPTPDGTGVRDYIHVTDLIDAHIAALHFLHTQPANSHIFNIGYGSGYSVLEVLKAVERVCDVKLPAQFSERRAGDPSTLIADNQNAINILGWQPRLDKLELIIETALQWQNADKVS